MIPIPERPLLMLDYDGTLAPITDDPAQAHPHPAVPELLTALQACAPLYIVSGRSVASIGQFLQLAALDIVGVHGAEMGHFGGEVTSRLDQDAIDALDEVRSRLEQLPDDIKTNLTIEDKQRALALHYRHSNDPEQIEHALMQWLDGLPEPLEPVWGKQVLDVRSRHVNKGTIVRELVQQHPQYTPVYLGDGSTDEDAFQALNDLSSASITVHINTQSKPDTAARYQLKDVDAVIDYLKQLQRTVSTLPSLRPSRSSQH